MADHVDRPDAAIILGVSPQTLAVWASTKRYDLPYIKVGRKVRYSVAALQAFLAKNTVGRAA